uniref:Uncharacterized protein n=1 Tax=Lepeophtheirus salmonis TaxID=72036 RepID=A0A0K2U6E2_LEPSM
MYMYNVQGTTNSR